MEHPARSIQACLDRLDIGYVDLMLLHNPDPNDVIPFIQDLGIVMQGWYPLGGRGHMGELLGDSVISEIAGAHGVSSAQVILRWNLQKGVVVIPGSSNPDHIRENMEIYHFSLTEDEMARIDALDRGEKHDWY
jgi:diketogulonate reductase-like aldo/keto reductase